MMSSLAIWSGLAAALFVVLAAILTIFPRLLLFLAQSSYDVLTPLELFLALQLAIFLAALALALFLYLPSSAPPLPSEFNKQPSQPLLYPLTIASNVSAFLSWNSKDVGSLSSIMFAINITIGLWGLWEIVFANTTSISTTTGADKHTSAFIFGNKNAASSVKRRLQKGG